jgi:hypothetical protein
MNKKGVIKVKINGEKLIPRVYLTHLAPCRNPEENL